MNDAARESSAVVAPTPLVVTAVWRSGSPRFSGDVRAVLGCSPGSAEAWWSRVHADDRAALEEARARGAAGWTVRYRLRADDEGDRWIEERGSAVEDGGVVTVHCDVTEQRAREDRSAHERAVLEMAAEVARVGAWWVELGPPTRVQWTAGVNQLFAAPTAGETQELGAALDRFEPADRERALAAFLECVRSGQSYELLGRMPDGEGRLRWVRSIGRAVRDASGAVIGVEGAAQDVTALKEAEARAAVGDRRFQAFADALPFLFFTTDARGETDFVNKHLYLFTGASSGDSPRTRWRNAIHPEDLGPCQVAWQAAFRAGAAFDFTYRLRRRDRSYRWHRVQATPIHGEDGAIRAYCGVALDVHETKELELRARRTAERLNTILDSMDDAFLLIGADGLVIDANAQAEAVFGRPRDLLVGRSAWQLDGLDGGRLEAECRRALADEAPLTFTERLATPDRWIEVRIFPSREGVAVFVRDVSASKAEEERRAELAGLLDKAQDAIVVRDLEGRVTYLNQRAEALYGWDLQAALRQDVRAMQFARRPEDFDRANGATLREGSWSGELEQDRRDGGTVRVEARWTLLRRQDGTPYGVLAINTDVTQRRRAEAQLLRAQRLESLGTLAGGIAHDLNNVLTPILGSIAYLRDKEGDPEKLEDLGIIEAQATRGADMVRQLLLFARGQPSTSRVDVDLVRTVAEVLRLSRPTFPRSIRTTVRSTAEVWRVSADPTQLQQVLTNLFVNARDAMPHGGVLTVSLENVMVESADEAPDPGLNEGPYVLVRVADTGVGIPPEIQGRVFEPFFTTKQVGEGTGLGLSTCEAIVRHHGGVIHLDSQVGRGTQFRVYLPASALTAGPSATASRTSRLPRGAGELILVVDDEEAVLRMTARTLERYGYRALGAGNGALAISSLASHRGEVALVLTDLAMPVMDGRALAVAVKALAPELPVVATSGLGEADAAGDGIDAFVAKPYPTELLLETIRRLIDARRPKGEAE